VRPEAILIIRRTVKMKRTITVISFFFLVLFGCSSQKKQSTDEVIPVKVIELKKEPVQKPVNVSGVFTTDDETYLSFKTGGIIKSIYVNEGDKVRKDQILAVLELNEIQAQVSQAKAAHEKALRDFNRVQNLYKDSVATLAQMQDAKTGYDIAVEQLSIAKYNLNHSEIRATDDGYILKKFVNEGQLAGPGTPIFQTNGTSKGNWILKAGISDHDWAIVKIGDKASIQSDVDPSLNIDAAVLRKSEGVDPYSGTFYVELKIQANQAGKIASGLFGKAKIFPKYPFDVWIVPYQSLLEGDGNNAYVFTTNDMETAKKINVNVFEFDKDKVYLNSGLDNSRYIIISGSAYLDDNSHIKIDKN
jgi:RND family efflux transporter MFP subunit